MTTLLRDLTQDELSTINGGGFLEDLAHALGYGIGATAGVVYNMCNVSVWGSGTDGYFLGHHSSGT